MKKSTFLTVSAALICFGTSVAALSDKQAQGAFKAADADASGALNKREFRTFIVAIADMGHAEAARAVRFGAVGFGVAFRDADKNKNGEVTLRELEAIR